MLLSDLASADIADLRDEGLHPTDEDVVRLHALALRITNGPETTAANAPRWALVGGVTLWQPTLAALEWYDYAKRCAGDEAAEDWLFAFACANGRRPGRLRELTDPAEIERELGLFLGSVAATRDELVRALNYVAMGNGNAVPEKTELAKSRDAERTRAEREAERLGEVERLISDAAAATGLTFDDLMMQTPSRLARMIEAAHVQAGMKLTKTSAAAHADYLATLHAIAARLREESAHPREDEP